MQILSWFAIAFYAFVIPLLLLSWVGYLRQEPELEADDRKLSIGVIAIAIVLCPLVLPFAYLNLMEQLKQTKSKIRLYQQIAETDSSPGPYSRTFARFTKNPTFGQILNINFW